jgi:hypothetical protein
VRGEIDDVVVLLLSSRVDMMLLFFIYYLDIENESVDESIRAPRAFDEFDFIH